MLKITIIYDNTVVEKHVKSDWGFAALIEYQNHNILFDTGADGHILLHNMKLLGIDPKDIDMVFISHHHFDHTGGLAAFLHENPDVSVYVPQSLRGIRHAREVHHITEACEILPDIFSSGELNHIEQCLFIKTNKGIVIVSGCSHPGISNILAKAEELGHVHVLFGGLHGFDNFKLLHNIDFVCPTHCTKHIQKIAELYPNKYIKGGVGRILTYPFKNERNS